MGYVPTLLIKYEDLLYVKEKLNIYYSKVDQYLNRLFEHPPVDFDGIKLFMCTPDMTGFNQEVRDRLYELEVYYAEDF